VTQAGSVVHLALYYRPIHRTDGVYKAAARPKTAAATPPRAYFGAPVGIAPESDPDEEEEESLSLSAPAAPPEPPEVDMVMDAVMDPVIELEESVSVVYVLVELDTMVIGTIVLRVSRDSGTVATDSEVLTTLVMGTFSVERLLSSSDVLEKTSDSTDVETGTVTISALPAESVVD